jgi:hypothetical protein
MKHLVKTVLILLSATLPTVYACSQPAPPPPGPSLAGPVGPGRTPPPPPGGPDGPERPGGRPIQQLIAVQGTISTYTASDSNAYDGLTLQNNGTIFNIRFAPHMAVQMMTAAKTGTAITVQGFYETTPEGINVIHLVSANSGSQTIYDNPPTPPANPPVESIMPFSGTITDLTRDRQGMPNGIVLSGDRIIELPPGVYDQLQAYLTSGTTVSGSGSPMTPPAGVVLVRNIQTIHPQTLTVKGQTYMVR